MAKLVTTTSFIEAARIVHGDRYNYDRVVYTRRRDRVTLLCQIHGTFQQIAGNHLSGSGCDACADDAVRMTTTSFISKATEVHKGLYNYSRTVYEGQRVKTLITCRAHGDFEQTPFNHLAGYGCRTCYDERQRLPQTTFLEKAREVHGDLYDYTSAVYLTKFSKLTIRCRLHGVFYQQASNHLMGHGCPRCTSRSRGEQRIEGLLKVNNITFEQQKTFEGLRNPKTGKKLFYDFYLPDLQILIEFDGIHHFDEQKFLKVLRNHRVQTFSDQQYRDALKNEFARARGLQLVRIPYYDFSKLDEILSALLQTEGVS